MKLTLLLCLVGASALFSCKSAPAKTNPTVSEIRDDKKAQNEAQEERILGKLLLENFVTDYGIYRDSKALTDYLIVVGNNLSYQFGRGDLTFRFGVLNTDEINAYSLPGGYIFLTRGLLKNIKTESELAAVLGHEIAHVNQKHIFNAVQKHREVGLTEALTSILSLGKAGMSAALNQAVGESVSLLTKNGMSAENEFEADEYGLNFAVQAGYRASDYVDLLKRLQLAGVSSNLSHTHPPFAQRIGRINKWINDGTVKNELRWDEMALGNRFSVIKI